MLTLDVTSDQSVEAAVREVVRRAGRIDVLVNNAGFGVAPAGAEESSIEQAQSIFDTNFFGHRPDDARRRTPHATAEEGDASSTSARYWASCPCRTGRSMPRRSTRSKAIRNRSTMSCARRGIRVSVIEPAYTKTPFDANFLEPDATLDEYREVRAAVNKRVKEVMATAEQPRVVADVVLKAASAARPKVRYTAGGLAGRLRLLRTYLPAGLMDAGIRRDLRLDAAPASSGAEQ